MRIAIIGAGAWGTALAIHGCRNPDNQITLFTQRNCNATLLLEQQVNQRYLPEIKLPANLDVKATENNQLLNIIHLYDLLILAVPMKALRSVLHNLRSFIQPHQVLAWLSKGFEQATDSQHVGLMGHEICQQLTPPITGAVFSGPTFAQEVALGKPCAIVAASTCLNHRKQLSLAFHHNNMRVYQRTDVIGVEIGGAVKNVLAIAVGLCDGLSLGYNARAALITRGLAEMTRLGLALGAKLDTFMGLSGMGDLVLTTTGDLSRNRRVGLLLAQGHNLEQILTSLGHVAEGVYSAKTVANRARKLGIEMPITELVVRLLDGDVTISQSVPILMQRQAKNETINFSF